MEFTATYILIILLAGGYGAGSGAGATGIEFNNQKTCEQAKVLVLNNKKITKVIAYCVEK